MFAVTSNVAAPVRHRPIALSAPPRACSRARRAASRVSSAVFFQDVTEHVRRAPARIAPATVGRAPRRSSPSPAALAALTEHLPRLSSPHPRVPPSRRDPPTATTRLGFASRRVSFGSVVFLPSHLFIHQTRALRVSSRAPRSARRASVAVRAADEQDVYIGKGRWVKDDPKKYAARDDWFTGGWPGGEVGLKESFIQEPYETPVQSSPLNPLPEDVAGEDTVYLGKGKFVKADAKKFAARDNLLTGGWAGGEVALKNGDALRLKPGDYVAIKNKGFFSFFQGAEKTGTVKKVEWSKAGNATVTVSVLPFDNVETFPGDALEKIEK
jgi:hypothetical protein